MDRELVVNRFLQRFAEDWAAGQAGSVDHYIATWPEHEDLVREQFALVTGDRTGGQGRMRAQLGPFQLDRLLGRGGQGEVWLALDERLERPVALKVLRGLDRVGVKEIERLEREAILASRLDHPAICPVFEAGHVDGMTFIAMRYVQGRSLAELIAAKKKDPEGEFELAVGPQDSKGRKQLCRFFRRTAEALAHAHDRGVLHRDVKPANLFVTEAGEPMLLDFGLARLLETEVGLSQDTRSVSGTPAYIAPEQLALPESVHDERLDVYSLGVTMFEAFTLERPFEGPTRERLFKAILDEAPGRLRQRAPSLPHDLETVVSTAMARQPDRRYRGARALAADLGAVERNEPIAARRPSVPARVWSGVRRHPALTAALVCALVAAASLGWLGAQWETIELGAAAERKSQVERAIELGYLEVGEGDRRLALEHFKVALELAPREPRAAAGSVLAHLELRDAAAARRALENLPADFAWRATLDATIRILEGDPAASTAIEASLPAAKTAEDWFLRGNLLSLHGHFGRITDHARAVDAFLNALALPYPDPPALYFALADALSHSPRGAWNRRVADLLAERWPDRPRVWHLVGMLLERLDPRGAEAAWRKSFALEAGPQVAMRLATLLAKRPGDRAESMEWSARARETAKTPRMQVLAWVQEARILELHGDKEGALAAFTEADRVAPRSTPGTWEMARLLTASDRGDEVEDRLHDTLRRRPGDPVALTWLANADLKRGRHQRAAERLDRALERNPWFADALYLRAMLHGLAGEHEQAKRLFMELGACERRRIAYRARTQMRSLLQAADWSTARKLFAGFGRRQDTWSRAVRALLACTLDGAPIPSNGTHRAEIAARVAESEGRFADAAEHWKDVTRGGGRVFSVHGAAPIHVFLNQLRQSQADEDMVQGVRAMDLLNRWFTDLLEAQAANPILTPTLGETTMRLARDPELQAWSQAALDAGAEDPRFESCQLLRERLETARARVAESGGS